MIRLRQVSLVTSCRVLAILGTAAGLRTNHWWQWQQRDHWWIITCHLWLDWFVTSKGMSKCHVLLNSDLKKSISVFVYSAIHSKLFTWPRWFLLQPSYGKARGTRALLFSFRHEVTWFSCVIFFNLTLVRPHEPSPFWAIVLPILRMHWKVSGGESSFAVARGLYQINDRGNPASSGHTCMMSVFSSKDSKL